MSILTKMFSGGAADLVKNIGGVVDSLHTSKEEKLEAERPNHKCFKKIADDPFLL